MNSKRKMIQETIQMHYQFGKHSILDWNLYGVDKVFHVDQAITSNPILPLQSKRWGYKSVPSSLAPIS